MSLVASAAAAAGGSMFASCYGGDDNEDEPAAYRPAAADDKEGKPRIPLAILLTLPDDGPAPVKDDKQSGSHVPSNQQVLTPTSTPESMEGAASEAATKFVTLWRGLSAKAFLSPNSDTSAADSQSTPPSPRHQSSATSSSANFSPGNTSPEPQHLLNGGDESDDSVKRRSVSSVVPPNLSLSPPEERARRPSEINGPGATDSPRSRSSSINRLHFKHRSETVADPCSLDPAHNSPSLTSRNPSNGSLTPQNSEDTPGGTPTAAAKARAMMHAKYFSKLLKKQNSEPNTDLGSPVPNGSHCPSPDENRPPGTFASDAVFCARCKAEVEKKGGEWVEKKPLAQTAVASSSPNNNNNNPSGRPSNNFFSSALSSVFTSISDDRSGGPYVGSIHFQLSYDFQGQVLAINVIEAKNLAAKDRGGTSDPYVKIFLLPEKKRKLETKVIMKNLNPTWNETLHFNGVPLDKLQKRILQLMVVDWDKFSKDDPIGEVNIPLCEIDFNQPFNQWKDLNPIAKEKYRRGEILVTLCYNAVAGILNITIVKCRDLKPMDISGTSDPYVKVYQMYQSKRVIKHKTTTQFQSLNPVYNETFTMTIPTTKLDDTQIVITVMDKDTLKWNEKIGSVMLAKRAGTREMQHWQDMLKRRRTPVSMWHHLRADLD